MVPFAPEWVNVHFLSKDRAVILTGCRNASKEGWRPSSCARRLYPTGVYAHTPSAPQMEEGCNHPDTFDQPLKGIKFVVDAGNGAAGFFATDVLEKLGADVEKVGRVFQQLFL